MLDTTGCVAAPSLPKRMMRQLSERIFRTSLLLACLSTLHLLASEAAWGQTPDPFDALSADEVDVMLTLLDEARTAEREARWGAALEIYHRLQAILPADEYRFRIAICLEQLGSIGEALPIYQELSNASDPLIARSATFRAQVMEEQLANRPAQLRVATRPLGALVVVGEVQRPAMALDGVEIALAPGEHRVRVVLEGFEPQEQRVALAPGEERALLVELRETPAPPAATERSGDGRLVLPIAFGSAALAAAVAGISFGLVSDSRAEDQRNYDLSAADADRRDQDLLAGQAQDFATAANISFAVAGGLLVTAVVLLFTGNDEALSEGDGRGEAAGSGLRLRAAMIEF